MAVRLLYGGRTAASTAFTEELVAAGEQRVSLRPQDEYGLLDLASLASVASSDARPLLEEVDAVDVGAETDDAADRAMGSDATVPAASGGHGTTGAHGDAAPAATEDDLAQFNAWLRGLGEL